MTDLGNLHHFLGISITCSSQDLFLSQRQYALDLQHAGMAEYHSTVCLFMHDLRELHMALIKRILRYVKGMLSFGFHIGTGPIQSLTTYFDWAGCRNSRRSTSDFCVYLGDNLVSWSSKR
ncbi:uncharacterized mitochondrial protein AtMg00810-like [Setaria viridis]|uniref:uncharacterized mitochondrial protein AtMg00810-like n=1 Tax=Setaria viridis TaxID=4556 RepID=UPI0014933736|nr:uncharacterized mitochondrial protein AtMg00810-like [Setaria viridis]